MIGVLAVERSYLALGSHVCDMAWDGHHLWYADAGTDQLYCLDVHTGTILKEEMIHAMSSAERGQGEDLIPGKYIRHTK